ncbi:hypothetical protein NH14_024670 [Paraburkholderia sacchari]|uniref:Uncharacterized protein n=2 Tax=Paraburkholderia sacchari TaxID=159450 RepID=A0A8T6ZJ66_9BURK|nr:hypothetical protein [Paraburkholderia sacchari]
MLSDRVIGAVITAIVGLIFWWIQRRLEPAAKVGYWVPHNFLFNVPIANQPNPLVLQTATLTVQNLGRKAAEGVEIVHMMKPDHFQLHPKRGYEERSAPDGAHIIYLESLGPKEVLQIQLLAYNTQPNLVGVRSKDGSAKAIRFQISRVFPRPILLMLQFCMFVGAFGILYWLVRAALYVSRANGML